MSDRYWNETTCGIEPKYEGGEPTLEQWRERCRQLWRENYQLRIALAHEVADAVVVTR